MMLTLMLAQDNFTTDMWSPYVWETILLWQKGKRLTKNGKGIISSKPLKKVASPALAMIESVSMAAYCSG
jgi:hypothetical protein